MPHVATAPRLMSLTDDSEVARYARVAAALEADHCPGACDFMSAARETLARDPFAVIVLESHQHSLAPSALGAVRLSVVGDTAADQHLLAAAVEAGQTHVNVLWTQRRAVEALRRRVPFR